MTGDNAVEGGFFGPNGEEVAGTLRIQTTSAGPDDGITVNDNNRRGFTDLRGVFQATCTASCP